MKDCPESLAAELARLTTELRQVEQRLDSESAPDLLLLNNFRNAVDNVRMKAWSVSELIHARYTRENPNGVLTFLAGERLRRLDQLVRNLCADIDRGSVTQHTSGMHSLSDSMKGLQQRITQISAQKRLENKDAAR